MTRDKTTLALLVTVLAAASIACGQEFPPTCTSTRPGGGLRYSFRTLLVPQQLIDDDNDLNTSWANKLCCTYTHVQVVDNGQARLRRYDGQNQAVDGDDFATIAANALDQIQDMSMGYWDYWDNKECIDGA